VIVTKVAKVEITRAEGPTKLCGYTRYFAGLKEASSWLLLQSDTFPKTGAYDKHDVTVYFEDGGQWSGRLDCKHHSCPNNDLDVEAHIVSVCEFYAGRAKNPWCGEEKYRSFLEQQPPRADAVVQGLHRVERPSGSSGHPASVREDR